MNSIVFNFNTRRENSEVRNKLKVLGILINQISHNLLAINYEQAKYGIEYIVSHTEVENYRNRAEYFEFGISLLDEMYHLFSYLVDSQIDESIVHSRDLAL